jgi:hypothetical protein
MIGLLSSNFLVVTVFPYYYLVAEFVRLHISRRTFLKWLALNIVIIAVLILAGQPLLAPVAMLATAIGWPAIRQVKAKRA